MLLETQDVELFCKLHRALMCFVNQRLQVLPGEFFNPEWFAALSPEDRRKVRDAFLGHLDLIQQFVDENPAHLTGDELVVVRSWQHLVTGEFYIFRDLKKYTVFLSSAKPTIAYGVLALSQPFEELVLLPLPVLTKTVLLPFKGMIVYDGMLNTYRITFGSGIRRSLNESFKEAKARHGIVTSLPMSQEPLPPKTPKPRSMPKPPTKEEKDEVLRVIIGLVDQFCKEHLNEEYAVLCRKLAEKLSRKRPTPLLHGSPNAWASGIVRAVGGVNFLHDKSQTPFMRATDIDHYLGTSPAAERRNWRKFARCSRCTSLTRSGPYPAAWVTTRWCGC
jgi:hypothetical protein